MLAAACSFCGNPGSLGPMPELWVCRSCARRIGNLAAANERARRTGVWSSQSRPARQPPAEYAEVERIFQEFKAGVEKQIPVEDFEVHYDLAEAYREMGLLADALREAGLVLLTTATRVTPIATKMTDLALRLVLTPPLLEPRGITALERLLRAAN